MARQPASTYNTANLRSSIQEEEEKEKCLDYRDSLGHRSGRRWTLRNDCRTKLAREANGDIIFNLIDDLPTDLRAKKNEEKERTAGRPVHHLKCPSQAS